jgi:drug/metabolite transporter (DMT)-like permease
MLIDYEKELKMKHMYKAGMLSLTTILFWAISNVFLRYSMLEYGCNQFAIACSNVLFSGLAMIVLGNHKTNVKKIITNYQTWVFGALQIFRNLFMIMAFFYISSTQANLLSNIEIIFSVFFAWFLFKRRPGGVDFIAMLFIFIGCFILVSGLNFEIMLKVTLFVAISSLLNALRTVIAEVHKDNKKKMDFKERLSVTGWIMFVSGITFILIFATLSFVLSYLPSSVVNVLPFIEFLPKPYEYIALNNVLCGLINGVVFYAFSMYCYLYAVSLSNSEYFMMFRSTQAIFTYMIEVLVSVFTVLPFLELNATDWIAAATIILSSASMVLMRTPRGRQLRQTIRKFMAS